MGQIKATLEGLYITSGHGWLRLSLILHQWRWKKWIKNTVLTKVFNFFCIFYILLFFSLELKKDLVCLYHLINSTCTPLWISKSFVIAKETRNKIKFKKEIKITEKLSGHKYSTTTFNTLSKPPLKWLHMQQFIGMSPLT